MYSGFSLLPLQLPRHNGKMTIVLDMDETLIHSIFLEDIASLIRARLGKKKKYTKAREAKLMAKFKQRADFILESNDGQVAVYLRPGLRRFLRKVSKMCEVVLWTAGERSYAEAILNRIDPDRRYFHYRLFREHCVKWKNHDSVKDLRLLGRNMSRTVLIDNDRMHIGLNRSNFVLIKDFYGDPKDRHLEAVWGFITKLSNFLDIRPHLKLELIALHLFEKKLEREEILM